ncbi:hypothetical protein GUJ93_ZPchr0002g25776 [Zizania palustris]|uniref:Uncharacterized protein n=1 Tax=Zizania palustris TaxID=103762 RepID=A0A8J5VUI2_ZIZPA|nr:hypothetical protein GUJ93_ZPchr0002g25776 [Zizania palustris]
MEATGGYTTVGKEGWIIKGIRHRRHKTKMRRNEEGRGILNRMQRTLVVLVIIHIYRRLQQALHGMHDVVSMETTLWMVCGLSAAQYIAGQQAGQGNAMQGKRDTRAITCNNM